MIFSRFFFVIEKTGRHQFSPIFAGFYTGFRREIFLYNRF